MALKMTVIMLAIATPLQMFVGDLHGLNTFEYQPMKVAAMEGHWETQRGAPLILFAIPDAESEENHFEVKIPKLGSLVLTHSLDGEVQGLKSVPAEDRPPVGPVFWSFRVMVGLGVVFIAVSILGAVQVLRGRLEASPRLLRVISWMIPLPFVAVLAGWFVTEVGRQPWIIYGIMRASDAVTPSLSGWMVLATLIGYIAVYATVFTAGITYLRRVVLAGPAPVPDEGWIESGHAKRPWSAVGETAGDTRTEERS